MSRCFTWFPIGGLGEPNMYHNSGIFYKNRGFYFVCWGLLKSLKKNNPKSISKIVPAIAYDLGIKNIC